MTDTTIGAVVFPQDPGTGVSSANADFASAAYFNMLARYIGGEYIDSGFDFSDVQTVGDTVDISAGVAFVQDDVSVASSQRNTLPEVQTTSATYDLTLPSGSNPPYVVVLDTNINDLQLDNGVNDIYLAVDVTSSDSVFIRHGTNVTAPENDATPKPAVKIGTVDTTNANTTRANDGGVISAQELNGVLTGNVSLTSLTGTNLSITNGILNATTSPTNNEIATNGDIVLDNAVPADGEYTRPFGDNGNGFNIYVDGANGNDNNSGSQANPVATIEEAASRCPYTYFSNSGVHVNADVYNNEPTRIVFPYIRHNTSVTRWYISQPNTHGNAGTPPGNPANFHIQSHIDLGGLGKNDHVGIKGIEMDGLDLTGWTRNVGCNVNPSADGENYCVRVDSASSYIRTMEIGTAAATTYGLVADGLARVSLNANTHIDGNTSALFIGSGSVVYADSNTQLNGVTINANASDANITNQITFEDAGMFVGGGRVFVGGVKV